MEMRNNLNVCAQQVERVVILVIKEMGNNKETYS